MEGKGDYYCVGGNSPGNQGSNNTASDVDEREQRDITYTLENTLPIDRGYAWWCLIGGLIVTFIGFGFAIRSIGIFYLAFIEYYGSDTSGASWIVTLMAGINASNVGGLLTPLIGARRGVMIGSLLISSGFILSSLAPSIGYLFITIPVPIGFGFSMAFTPTVAHVNHFFDKRRGLAQGMLVAGSPVGGMLAAPFVTFLIETYGLRGALLIFGGVSLHLLVGAMLLRPLSFYKPRMIMLHKIEIEIPLTNTNGSSHERVEASPSHRDGAPDAAPCCNVSILKNHWFLRHVAYFCLMHAVFISSFILLLPGRGKEVGFTPYEISAVLIAFSAGDAVGRLSVGRFTDLHVVPNGLLMGIVNVAVATILLIGPVAYQKFIFAVPLSCVMGFGLGSIFPLRILYLAARFTKHNFQKALIYYSLIACLPILLYGQAIAELTELTGSWDVGFYIASGVLLLIACCLFLEEWMARRYMRK